MNGGKEIMTKKHYELIALAMRNAQKDTYSELNDDYGSNQGAINMTMVTLTNVIYELSEAFAKDNGNFDIEKFTEACVLGISDLKEEK